MKAIKKYLITGSACMMLAVIFGAFGAHYLESRLTPDQLHSYETGVEYMFYHSIAILFLSLIDANVGIKFLSVVYKLFMGGIVMFSGSIYLLSCKDLIGISAHPIIGILTPIGGMMFILGWLVLLISAIQWKISH